MHITIVYMFLPVLKSYSEEPFKAVEDSGEYFTDHDHKTDLKALTIDLKKEVFTCTGTFDIYK